MPRKRNDQGPPPTMTWAKALPVLVIAFIFYALQFLFEQFWFFGPALAGVYCTAKVGGALSKWTIGLLGTKTAAAACGASATLVGYVGAPVIGVFGAIMAMAVGLFGWLTVGLILLTTNGRIFKENAGHALWFVAGLAISEVPIIGSIPGTLGITIKMYHAQIKKEKAALKKYNEERAAEQLQERERRIAEFAQERAAQLAPADIY